MRHWDAQTLIKTLRYVNVVLAIMQAFAGFSGIFDLVVLDVTSFLISVYAMYVSRKGFCCLEPAPMNDWRTSR